MSFGFYKLKTFSFFLISLFLALVIPLHPAQAFVEWLGKVIIGGLLWIILFIPVLIAQAFTILSGNFLVEVSNPSFVTKRYIEIGFVKDGWTLCANLAGIFLVLALIAIGIGVALRMIREPQKALVRFITAAVLIPFTPIIAGFIIDFSNIFTFTFFRTGAAQGFLGGISLFSSACDAFSSMFAPGAGFLDSIFGIVAILLFLAIYGFYVGLILFRFGILFFARYIALWVIIILSPLAFCFYALSIIPTGEDFPIFEFFKKLGGYYKKWWEELFAWSTIGIMGSFFLYIGGITANSLLTSADANLIDGSWFLDLMGQNILPFLIPIVIIQMGYKYTMQWAPAVAATIISTVEGTIKTAAVAAGGIAIGAATAGAGAAMGSKTGQAAASSMQTKGAAMMQKPGLKTFGYAVNRMGTNAKSYGAKYNKQLEDNAKKQMEAMAGIDKGETLRGMAIPKKNLFNSRIVEQQEKAKAKALLEQDKKEFEKGKIKTGDPRLQSMLETATAEFDKDIIKKIFSNNPGLIKSTDGFAMRAKGLLTTALDKDTLDQARDSTQSKISNLDDKKKGALKDVFSFGKDISDNNLQLAGFSAQEIKNIKEERTKAFKTVDKNIKGQIFKTLKEDDIQNWKKEDFSDPETIQNLAKDSSSQTKFAASVRNNTNFFKELMAQMLDLDNGYRAKEFVNFLRRPDQIALLGREKILSEEMMDATGKFGFNNKELLTATLKDSNTQELENFINKMDETSKQKLFSKLNDENIQALGDKIAQDIIIENMIKYSSVDKQNGRSNNLNSYIKAGGIDLVNKINEKINEDSNFRETIVLENPQFLKFAITPNAAIAGIQVQMPPESTNKYINNPRDIESYRNYYSRNQQSEKIIQDQNMRQRNQTQQQVRQKYDSNRRTIGGYEKFIEDIDREESSDQGFSRSKYE
ncbi:MAG TPA: hypothetical protein PKL98_00130 [Candidatus Pacearchaeota archaeon]|nr:hypothetical protein [Candidatus Pacearchaeota archaeon]